MSRYSLAAYYVRLLVTGKKVLLVEGPEDKGAFQRIITDVTKGDRAILGSIDVDSADMLEAPDQPGLGNRQKVEEISAGARVRGLHHKLVGFVDREFRGFVCGNVVEDLVPDHVVEGGLVWSRGHSIENYCFDFGVLREPLRIFTTTAEFDRTLAMFEGKFMPALLVACAASLAGKDVGFLDPIRASITWKLIQVKKTEVSIDPGAWREVLLKKIKLSVAVVDEFLNRFAHWREILAGVDPNVIRWLCHGHIGFVTLWATYASCVFEVTGHNEGDTSKVLSAPESVRFYACVDTWVRQALAGGALLPWEVLDLLGVTAS
jgi:hypothetical protein